MRMSCVDDRPKSIIKIEDNKIKARTPISLIKSKKNSEDIKLNKHSHKSSHISKLKQSVVTQEHNRCSKPEIKNKSPIFAKIEQTKKESLFYQKTGLSNNEKWTRFLREIK